MEQPVTYRNPLFNLRALAITVEINIHKSTITQLREAEIKIKMVNSGN